MEELHEPFIRRTYVLARQAIANGNQPFGALLMLDGQIVLEAENSIFSANDLTCHAELNLVSRGLRTLPVETIRRCTLYTSTEPCAMCTGAIHWAGISRIVYGCPAEALGAIAGGSFVIPCREIIRLGNSSILVIGPVLMEEGIEIHRNYWNRKEEAIF